MTSDHFFRPDLGILDSWESVMAAATTMTTWQTISAKWEAAKPAVYALAIGLVAGPFISNMLGWQVTSGSAQSQARAGVVEQGAMLCEERARREVKDTGKLDWSARSDLAKKWSIMPGSSSADSEIASACARRLAT